MTTRREFFVQSVAATTVAASSVPLTTAASNSIDHIEHGRMRTTRIAGTDLTVSRLAFGCAMLGWDWNSPDLASRTMPIIRTAYEQGITFFDIADVYGYGKCETALGQVLKESPGMRHQIVIQSKCGDRFSDGGTVDNSREHIITSVEGSLKRLGTDHLDILLLHWPDSLVEPEEVAKAFDELKHSGKVRYFGVSNHSPTQLELLQRHLHQRLIANQIQLGLMHWYVTPNAAKASLTHAGEGVPTLDYCRLNGIWVQAYSPLKSDNIDNPPSLLNPPANPSAELKKAVELLGELAKKYEVTPAAIMLAWLLRHPAGITPIIGATKSQHVVEGSSAERVELTRIEWYSLLAAAAAVMGPSNA